MLISAATLLAGAAFAQTPSDRSPQSLTGQDRSHVTLYGQPGLSGARYMITMRTGNLNSMQRVESLRVFGGKWEICDRLEFQGECRIAEGRYLTLSDLGLRRIASLRPVA
ncbi:beta/gamma crystallin-related protein [Brevundimonas sp.]|uniref:beta/gamma crystallin-related protein n=1 Tax=Brevundimonas sp. TaxID=1871086 RepID=UPI003FA5B95E